MEYESEISYSVCRNGGCCYSPANAGGYFDSVYSQKQECDRWLEEQKVKYPDGWVTQEGFQTTKLERYPNFHANWNHLMDAFGILKAKGIEFIIPVEIDSAWKIVFNTCESLKSR